MGAECRIKLIAEVTGLGQELEFSTNFTTATPTLTVYHYHSVGTSEEALELGEISTVEFVVIKNTDGTNYVEVDCDFVTTFDTDIQIDAGKSAIFKPSGTVKVKANTAACIVEYIVIGTA